MATPRKSEKRPTPTEIDVKSKATKRRSVTAALPPTQATSSTNLGKTAGGFTKRPELRRQAEKLLRATQHDAETMPVKDMQRLVYELQVHQIEQDMQNEELRRAQSELESARDRYMELYDFAPAAHLTLDAHGTIVEANLRAGTLLGINRKELIGQPLIRFFAAEDQILFHRHCREVLKTGTRQSCEGRLRDKAGATSWVQLESLAIHDGQGHITRWRTALLDINKRKRDEQAKSLLIKDLSRSQQHFQTLFNWTPSAVGISTVAEGRFIEVNEALSRLTGYKREEMIGRTSIELGLWADPSERATMLRDIQEQGRLHNREGRLRTKSGETRSLMVYLDLIQFENVPCLIYLAHDITERKRTEKALRLAKFSVERAADAVYWVDSQAKILDVNEAASRMLGYSKDELCAMTVHDLNPDFQADMWPGFWEETQRRGTMVMETAHRAKDGRLIPIEVSVNFLIHEGKEYHCAFVRDMTERKRAEVALKASETRFRAIFDQTFQFIGLLKTDGTLIEANRSALQFAGIREEDVLGKLFWDTPWWTHSSELQGRLREAVRRAAGGTMVRFEATHPQLTGGLAHVDFSLKPVRDEHGNVTLLIPEGRDITERKRVEEERNKQESLISLMLNTGPGCIKRVAADGTLLQMNSAGLKLIEADCEDEALGLCVFELVVPEHRVAFIDMHHDVLAGRSRTIQYEIQGLKGTRRWMESHAAPFKNPVSGETEHLAVTHDITERKRADGQLRDTLDRVRKLSRRMESVREEERTRIARELHDELGVRLTCLKLDLARLQSLTREPTFSRDTMEEKIGSMTAEVDATIAEVQRLVVELRPGILDDLGLVAAMEWQCQDFERRSGIRCLFEASHEQIDLDRAQATAAFRICQEALTNVARHAKATFVRVLVAQGNGDLLLEVQDDGEGIPAEKPVEAFSFGLLGIQERASSLGGQAEIAGWPGKGTTVTVRLPVA